MKQYMEQALKEVMKGAMRFVKAREDTNAMRG